MKNKLEWKETKYGEYSSVYIRGNDYDFHINVNNGTAYCNENFSNRRIATVKSKKGADHLKDKIIEKTIAVLLADVDKLRKITGMEVPK